jgi:hypothetical protein
MYDDSALATKCASSLSLSEDANEARRKVLVATPTQQQHFSFLNLNGTEICKAGHTEQLLSKEQRANIVLTSASGWLSANQSR